MSFLKNNFLKVLERKMQESDVVEILLSCIYPRKIILYVWTCIHIQICSKSLIIALRVRKKNIFKCSSVEKWINKLWYVHEMDSYTAVLMEQMYMYQHG